MKTSVYVKLPGDIACVVRAAYIYQQTTKMNTTLTPEELERRKKINKKIYMVFIPLIVLFIIVKSCASGDTPKTVKENDNSELKASAFSISKMYFEKRVNDASSFDAPHSPDQILDFDSTYVVTSHFSAKNGFGGVVKNIYKMNLQYLGGDPTETKNWEILEVTLNNKKIQ